MARDKAYPSMPVVVTFLPTPKAKKTKKKIFKNKTIDDIIEGLESGTLVGIPSNAEIKHIGVGSMFM